MAYRGTNTGSSSRPRAAPSQRPLVSHFDQYMASVNPHYRPMTEFELKSALFTMGATEATFNEHLDAHNLMFDEMLADMGGSIPIIGERPKDDDRSVYYVDVPGTRLTIRMWDGGMNAYGQFFLDFFDTAQHQPVNKPRGYQILHSGRPSVYVAVGPLKSWEEAMKHRLPEAAASGPEKFSVPEATEWCLTRPGHADLFFAVPHIQGAAGHQVVQPVRR